MPNHGHHLDAKQLYTNTLKHAHHGAQDELMHSTPDQHKITIIVTACSSWTLRSIESAKVFTFLPKFCAISKVQPWNYIIQRTEELLIDIIKLNKGKAWKPSKQLQALEQLIKIFKETTNVSITWVNTTTTSVAPTELHTPTHKHTVIITPQTHQQQKRNNTLIISTTSSKIPIYLPNEC